MRRVDMTPDEMRNGSLSASWISRRVTRSRRSMQEAEGRAGSEADGGGRRRSGRRVTNQARRLDRPFWYTNPRSSRAVTSCACSRTIAGALQLPSCLRRHRAARKRAARAASSRSLADRASRRRPSRVDNVTRVYTELRALIISGQLPPGARIAERAVVARMGLSRTPVRSALHRLQQEGLVASVGRAGDQRLIVTPLTRGDGREVFLIVGHLEGFAASEAASLPAERAEAARHDACARSTASSPSLAKTKASPARLFDLDLQFHATYVEGVAGPRVVALHRAIKPQSERYARLYVNVLLDELPTSVKEHEAIAAAIAKGDPPRRAARRGDELAERGRAPLGRDRRARRARQLALVGRQTEARTPTARAARSPTAPKSTSSTGGVAVARAVYQACSIPRAHTVAAVLPLWRSHVYVRARCRSPPRPPFRRLRVAAPKAPACFATRPSTATRSPSSMAATCGSRRAPAVPARRLTATPDVETDPHFSPDGSRIAFSRTSNGNTDVYVVADRRRRADATDVPSRESIASRMDARRQARRLRQRSRERAAVVVSPALHRARRRRLRGAAADAARVHAAPTRRTATRIAYEEIPTAFIPDWYETSFWRHYRGGRVHPIRIIDLATLLRRKAAVEGQQRQRPDVDRQHRLLPLRPQLHANLFSYDLARSSSSSSRTTTTPTS